MVCELARLLGVPHVHYELAHEYEGPRPIQPGVVYPTFVPRPQVLVLGNQLLVIRDSAYPAEEVRKYGVREYTAEAVADIVSLLKPPDEEWMQATPSGITTSLEVFTGYVMLDAWVANQDRHHQNWGAIWHAPDIRLAPTFDHGASLARNLTDEERKERLHTRDRNRTIEQFCSRARSGFYTAAQKEKTVLAIDVFRHFAVLAPNAARIWLGRLAKIDLIAVDAILAEIPPQRMSPVTREFTLKLLMTNQRRLLEGIGQ